VDTFGHSSFGTVVMTLFQGFFTAPAWQAGLPLNPANDRIKLPRWTPTFRLILSTDRILQTNRALFRDLTYSNTMSNQPSASAPLVRLARLLGIQTEYVDVRKQRHKASSETLLALCNSLGVEIAEPGQAAAARERSPPGSPVSARHSTSDTKGT
jgi:hypothetical protein